MRHAPRGVIDKVKGDINSMDNWVMRHLLAYNYNLYIGFEDQLKNVQRPWNTFEVNYDENAFLESSGIALLFNLIT